jgi:hypothetical protein
VQVPLASVNPLLQTVATVFEVQTEAPVPHAEQAPAATKYPELQATHPVAVLLTQDIQFVTVQAVQVPGATIMNPELQDEQEVTLGVAQVEQYAQPVEQPVVPVVPAVP